MRRAGDVPVAARMRPAARRCLWSTQQEKRGERLLWRVACLNDKTDPARIPGGVHECVGNSAQDDAGGGRAFLAFELEDVHASGQSTQIECADGGSSIGLLAQQNAS